MIELDLSSSPSQKDFFPRKMVIVQDRMQKDYQYELQAPYGEDFAEGFCPELSPAQMLEWGVFEGKYLNDCTAEFPREWFEAALKKQKLSAVPDPSVNYFQIKSRLPLSEWCAKGWIGADDPDVRGWFQWYCRYYIGRREPALDERQIKRWRAFRRHKQQVIKNCAPNDLSCRPRQRQGLLQWAYHPLI